MSKNIVQTGKKAQKPRIRNKRKPKQPGAQVQHDLKVAQAFAKATGSRGTAPLVPSSSSDASAIKLIQSTNAIKVTPTIADRALSNVAMAIVLRAQKRGASYPDVNLYEAYRFLYNTFYSAAKGEEVQGVSFPPFVWEIINALGTKKPYFKTGYADLNSTIIVGSNTDYLTSQTFPYNVNFGTFLMSLAPADPTVTSNGFACVSTAPPGVYDPKEAAPHANKLWAFLNLHSKLFTLQEYKNPITKYDTSAYATVINDRGRAWDGVGAIRTTLSAETFIQSPLLSKFCVEIMPDQQVGPGTRRGFFHYRPSAGAAAYLGARATEFDRMDKFHNKMLPLFKDINFFRVFDRFSVLLCRIQEQSATNQVAAVLPPYPLTSQRAAIMLRSVLMRLCANEMCYDTDNLDPQQSEVALIPFAPGMATPYSNQASPEFPSFFRENLRSLRRRTYRLGIKGDPSGIYEMDMVTRLCDREGRYDTMQYYWSNFATPLYLVDANETPINMIDGTTTVQSTTRIAVLEGHELSNYITEHNKWMKLASACTTSLGVVGDEGGPTIWALSNATCHTQTIVEAPQIQIAPTATPTPKGTPVLTTKVSKKIIKVGSTMDVKATVGAVPDEGNRQNSSLQGVTGYTFVITPMAALFKYQRLFILPEREVTINDGEASIDWYRSIMLEPAYARVSTQGESSITQGQTTLVITQLDLAKEAADVDIKQNLAEPSEWDKDVDILATKGDGGWLSAIASMVGNAVGVPEAGNLVRMLEKGH